MAQKETSSAEYQVLIDASEDFRRKIQANPDNQHHGRVFEIADIVRVAVDSTAAYQDILDADRVYSLYSDVRKKALAQEAGRYSKWIGSRVSSLE